MIRRRCSPGGRRGSPALWLLGLTLLCGPAACSGGCDSSEGPPLHRAAKQGDAASVRRLLGPNSDVDAPDEYGRTPLYYARGFEVTKLLVNHGADVNREFPGSRTKPGACPPLAMAEDAPSLLYMLDHGGGDLNLSACGMQGIPLLLAIRWGDLALVKDLVARGARLDWDGHSPALAEAARFGDLAAFRYLLSRGAPVHGTDPDSGDNLLHAAASCHKDNTAIARILLQKGVPVNARNVNDETPLHAAVHTNPEMVRLLVENGADTGARDGFGERPVDLAVRLRGVSSALTESAGYLSRPSK